MTHTLELPPPRSLPSTAVGPLTASLHALLHPKFDPAPGGTSAVTNARDAPAPLL